jgi:CheY-like chemotaxis protein
MKPRILLVEDNPITRKMVRFALENKDFVVLEAPDGATAFHLLKTEGADLVLQDLVLPDTDGFELVHKLRSLPNALETPILAFSGFLTKLEEAHVSAVGFDDVITKPVEPSRLLQIIKSHLPASEVCVEHFGRGKRIVVADDDAVQRKLACFRLARFGLDILGAADGAEALDLIRDCRPHAVVADILMPGLDGFGLCMAMRHDEALASIPVILITNSYVDVADRELAVRVGARGCFLRTPEMKDVVDLLRDILGSTSASGEKPAVSADFIDFEIERERGLRATKQLERQVAVNAGVAQRCATLSAELSVLNGISEALARRENIEPALKEVLAACLDAGGISVGALYVHDSRGSFTVHKYGCYAEWTDDELDTFFGHIELLQSTIAGRKTTLLPSSDAPHELSESFLAKSHGASILVVPLIHGKRSFGALVMISDEAAFDSEDRIAFAEGVANQISVALALAHAFTEKDATQAQLMVSDRLASIGALAAGVAHEINNPLSVVVTNLELAFETLSSPASRDAPLTALGDLTQGLEDAREAAQRVCQIVKDLKIFSRADEDRLTAVDVERVLESSLRMARNEIHHRARVIREYDQVPGVEGNESRLGQVFLNIIVNAAQAIPEGQADKNEIRIATRRDGARVVIDVTDTGSGIPPELMSRLFTPFFTTKATGVGTGLGLSICQRLLTAMGGEITVESVVGRGTTFHVKLLVAAEQSSPTISKLPPPTKALARGRVLVVDDEVAIGNLVCRLLRNDHDVLAVTRASEALERITQGARFDLILCDLMMPVVTGMDLYASLRSLAPDQADKMIFLTGGAFTATARAFLDDISNPCIEKPFNMHSLRTMVNERTGHGR